MFSENHRRFRQRSITSRCLAKSQPGSASLTLTNTSLIMVVPVFPIIPTTQQYDWGKIGLTSKVAQYASASKIPGFTLEEDAPYAEVRRSTIDL